jgi:hypothetical protein
MIVKQTHTALLAALLLGASGGVPVHAQEGFSYAFKVRFGLTAGDIQKTTAHMDNKVMAFGAEVKKDLPMLGNGAAVSAELGWEYVPGRHHDVYPWQTTNPIKSNDGSNLNSQHSVDNRKEFGAGFTLRFAYSMPMPQLGSGFLQDFTSKTEWFAGLGIDMHKVNHEFVYTFNFTPTASNPFGSQNPIWPNAEGDNGMEQGTNITPGIFAGLRYKFNDDIRFELTLRNFGMWHYEYLPYSYLVSWQERDPEKFGRDQKAYWDKTSTIRGWAVEFAIAARL